MTTERKCPLRRCLRFGAGATIVLGLWTAILAGLALTLPPGAPLAVFAPGFAQRLYEAGALLARCGTLA